jgi:hypothetical protein
LHRMIAHGVCFIRFSAWGKPPLVVIAFEKY